MSMRRFFLIILLSVLVAAGYSQDMRYNVVARCSRDMRIQVYGDLRVSDIEIGRHGDKWVNVGDTTYTVMSVDKTVDTDSIKSVQYTIRDVSGREFVIVFTYDKYNKVDLMRYQVILFNTGRPYDWTYNFTEEPKEE